MSEEYFKAALRDFTVDFAAGGAIRVMADKGYSVKKIKGRLDYPLTEDTIREIVWKHYVDTGVICIEDPNRETSENTGKVTYQKVQDEFGRTSFVQVAKKTETGKQEYVACDFGKMIYQNKRAFEESLKDLSEDDRDYILGLPWPLATVWHIRNERTNKWNFITEDRTTKKDGLNEK